MTIKSWLWPDRIIGKRESRRLREEHNHAVNEIARLKAELGGYALRERLAESRLAELTKTLRKTKPPEPPPS